MTLVALAISVLIAGLGALGVVSPEALVGVVRSFQTSAGLYAAAGIRLVFGAALFFAARKSRAPDTIRVLGVLIIVAGLITPLIGLERFTRLFEWWSGLGPGFTRTLAAFTTAVCLLLAYAVLPRTRAA